MKKVEIYTDGACSGNPGPGGYGAVLIFNGIRKELSCGYIKTTNNRMELLGVIRALEALKEPCEATVYSDSKYVVESIEKDWIGKWKAAGWMRTKKEPAKNADLWKALDGLLKIHSVSFVWVKGHASTAENNRCDKLATGAVLGELIPDAGFSEHYPGS